MKSKKILLTLAISAVLTACGGGSGSSSNSSNGVVGISGTPAKGIMYGAKITAQQYVGGAFVDFSPAVTTRTNLTTGKYSLDIPNDYTGVVRIVTEAVSGTTMRCDYDACATAGVNFGDKVAVAAGFKMNALLSGVSGQSVTVNPNVLTHMAAALAEKNGVDKTEVDKSSQQIAATYGITGSLGSIASVDITDPSKVNDASSNAIRINMLSAAIMNSAKEQNTGSSLEQALAIVTNDYASNDGALLEKDTAGSKLISRNDINKAMSSLLAKVKAKANSAGVALTSIASVELDITSKKNELAGVSENDSNAGRETLPKVDPNASASDIDKSKAMLTQIRNLVAATNGNYGDFGTLKVGADAFSTQVEAIAVTQDPSMEAMANLLAEVSKKIVDHFNANPSETSYPVTGIPGVDITATNTNWPATSGITSGKRSASVVGSVTVGTLKLTLSAGSKVEFDFTTETSGSIKTNTINSASFVMPGAKLVSTATGKEGDFVGNVKLEAVNAVEIYDTILSKTTKSTFASAKIEFTGGTFTAGESSVTASFVGDFNGDKLSNGQNPDSASNFVKGSGAMQFKTAINAVDNNVTVTISSDTQKLGDSNATVKIKYDVTSMIFNTPSTATATALTVSNQNGVKMSLVKAANGDVSGDIKVNGNKSATVTPSRIEFTDGTFESL